MEREPNVDEQKEEDRKRCVPCFGLLVSYSHFVYHAFTPSNTLVLLRILALYKQKRDEEGRARGRMRNQLQEDQVLQFFFP